MTTPRATAWRVIAGLGCLGLTAGSAFGVAAGATAAGNGDLDDEMLVLPLAGRYDTCAPGATSYSFTLEGDATGPWSGHYVAQVTAQVDGPSLVRVVNATIGTPDGDVRLTQTGATDLGPAGVCAPIEPGQVLTWDAEMPVGGKDVGTAVLTGGESAVVDRLTSTAANGSGSPSADPSPTGDPVPEPPVPGPTGSTPASPPESAQAHDPTTVDAAVAFHYRVVARDGRLSGTCDVQGGTQTAPVHVVCSDVRTYERHGHTLDFSGAATLNGRATTYRISIVDSRAPAGGDSFVIRVGDDYVGGGELTSGDLQVR
jgi:hypothetical protein